ncbi:MAG: hypothetical protein ACD_56C00057G0006 [uncultured bacterium]|nr:MAG: hypothetical protein ACD_56C00057G0006 [uncultured bacterium]
MSRKLTIKFWITFWTISAIFLSGWFLFWNVKNQGLGYTASKVVSFLPIDASRKSEYQALIRIGDYFLKKDGEEKTLLTLFLNNMELRPGGGFIGAFGIVKMKDGKMISFETHDLSNFDARIPKGIEPPYPMQEIGYVDSWKLRDSNFSPDFQINAEKAEEFYRLAGGNEQFDGVIGITSNVLSSVLKITGPIQLQGYPGTYDSGNAILALEYQVEKAFEEQGIDRKDRKSIMADLAAEIEKRIFNLSFSQSIKLTEIILDDLSKKDIQLQFADSVLQGYAAKANWTGSMDVDWKKDYLMIVDANLGAFKSDYHVKRSIEYSVDLSPEKPRAMLKITYDHTATQKDWMTRNYLTYLRIYVPDGSELVSSQNFDDYRSGNEFNKKFFGSIVRVPISESKTVEIIYDLPALIRNDHALKIQKQAGINDTPVLLHITGKDEKRIEHDFNLNEDATFE